MDNLSNELSKLKIDRSQRSDKRPPKRSRAWIAAPILAITALILFLGLRNTNAALTVDTVRPRVESSSQSAVLVASGYIVAHHKIEVGSKIMGRVAWIGVEKGDLVKRDQIVVRLEDKEYRAQFEQAKAAYEATSAQLAELVRGSRPEEIDRAKADMERASAQLVSDQADYKRTQSLVQQGVLSAQSLDDAKGKYESSVANLASLTKTYELTRKGPRQEQIDNMRASAAREKAAMDYAETILDATEIRVPSDGTILERNVEQGEMVTTGFVGDQGAKSFVVTLADLNDLQVELDINQNDFNRIQPNQPCTLVTDAFPDKVYKCQVAEIAPEANRQKATVQVKVKILQPDSYVKPEMNAQVTFLDPQTASKEAGDSKLIVVPKRAIVDRDSGKAVLVISDGKVQPRPVTVDREVGSDVVISAGLAGSETIIVGDQLTQLKAGDRVEPKK
jgi:HlyD family secretion protein